MRRTKIVCTIGPASSSPKSLQELIRAGMDVARLNFSHGSQAGHLEVIKALRKLAPLSGKSVAIIQDLAGPKIRIGRFKSGKIILHSGDNFILTDKPIVGDNQAVSVSYPGFSLEVKPGDSLLLADGALELEVIKTDEHNVRCRVIIGGPLSSYKGVNLPSRSLKVPSLTEKDKQDLEFGLKQRVDYIALSFIKTAEDILAAKQLLKERKASIPLIAKIEKHEALDNIDDIIEVVDGIMIARGDLGVEIPLESIPLVQKSLIRKANLAGKPVITATQMLKSMVDNPRPTRAEVTDVANAILDGTDAVMLSEETAVGKYPVKAVSTMSRIAEDAESGFPFEAWTARLGEIEEKTLPEAVGCAAVNLADQIKASTIVSFTQSGSTALLVSKYRPRQPIIAATPSRETYRRLALVWGVIPILTRKMDNTDELIKSALAAAQKRGLVKSGEKVVITAGVPVGIPGSTNLIKAEVIY